MGGAPNTLADESSQLLVEAQAGQGVPIIGAGTRRVLNNAGNLASRYDGRSIQVHWYQNFDTGFATEFKTKLIGPWFGK
jgi:hypothetical protein